MTSPASPPSRARLTLDLIRFDRPAGWLLLLWPTLSALWIAADGFPACHLPGVFVLGTILVRSAGCCVNGVADRDTDQHVKRTAQRPVTRGALSVRLALGVEAVLALAAFALVLSTNAPTILLSFAALAVTLFYLYAKRMLAMPQAVLGVAVAAAQAVWHFTLIKDRTREGCFKAFRLNQWLGFTVFLGVAGDLAYRYGCTISTSIDK